LGPFAVAEVEDKAAAEDMVVAVEDMAVAVA
jgi:hypothetical protein